MSSYNPKVDAYIEKAQPFAKPLLNYIREIVHEFCPDTEEAIKWGFPCYVYQGKNLCSMASFKQHIAFGFWLESHMQTIKELGLEREKTSSYSIGKIRSMDDLPSKPMLKKMIYEAMKLTEEGVTQKRTKPEKVEMEIPDYFQEALSKNNAAQKIFESKSPSFRKEYITWLTDAKTETTRNKRMVQALEWIAEGKGRNWKYERK